MATVSLSTENVITINIPGKFYVFWEGSGPGQGLDDVSSGYVGGEALYAAMCAAKHVRAGTGYYLRVTLSGPSMLDALDVLYAYAHVCLDANTDEPDANEVVAARNVKARCESAFKMLKSAGL